MRIFTLALLAVVFSVQSARAQCTTPGGMIATSLTLNGNCFMYVQNAIPFSSVSIYSNNGYAGQSFANGTGFAYVSYSCASNPIVSVLSISLDGDSICNVATISTPIPLPVKFSAFTSKIVAQGVLLKWSTSYELNNEKYIIEKSTNGSTYQAIGQVASGDNSIEVKDYQFIDASFQAGQSAYYRIRQVDIDQTTTFSKVVYVNDGKTSGPIKVFPNPFANEIQISGIRSADLNKGNVRLFNLAGAAVNYTISGSNAIRVDSNIPAGVYVLMVNGQSYKISKN